MNSLIFKPAQINLLLSCFQDILRVSWFQADQICYAVLCVFSFVAAHKSQNQQAAKSQAPE